MRRVAIAVLILLIVDFHNSHALAQGRVRPAPAGTIALPRNFPDNQGNQWMLYPGGYFQQQGNMPVYSQGGMLMVNNQAPNVRVNMARVDEKTGEIILDGLNVGGLTVTRRIKVNTEEGYIRYVDIFQNGQGREQTVNVVVRSSTHNGIQVGQAIADTRKETRQVGWVGQTPGNRTVVEWFAGKGGKSNPTANWPQGNNYIDVNMPMKIGANEQVAIVHVHGTAASQEAGMKWVRDASESNLLKDLPEDIRKAIVNFRATQSLIGDLEILRGDAFDVVELRGGDQIRGLLQEPVYRLQTFYGLVELPVERVIAMVSVGDFRPRQLLVTPEGEIFGGELQSEVIRLQLSSGQTTSIPLKQITRLGYRRRATEPAEWVFSKPIVLMRAGDRVSVEMPTAPIEIVTRYGKLSLNPASISAIIFQSVEHGVHEVQLVDGSRFLGLVVADQFEMTLAGTTSQQVRFPLAGISRIQFTPAGDMNEDAGQLNLMNNELLVGTLGGQLRLHTAFDTLVINGPEIKHLARIDGSATDVQITLWDDSTVSGQLEQQEIECALEAGVTLKAPLAMVEQYEHPLPKPSAAVLEEIKQIVEQLSADDWKERDQAEAKLLAMGVPVMAVLKELRAAQPPEAQQRIDGIIKQLEQQREKQASATYPDPAPNAAIVIQLQPVLNKDFGW